MPIIGKSVQPFVAQAYQKGDFVEVTEANLKGQWSIFFFYPADFTFVCPTELEDLADHYAAFQKIGAEIYSVSTDTHFSHMAWAASSPAIGKIGYPMLGDPAHHLATQFDVLREGAGLADRATFVVDPDGIIQLVEITSEGVGRNAAELLRKVTAAIYVRDNPGQVCPAKWVEGAATLTPSAELVGKI